MSHWRRVHFLFFLLVTLTGVFSRAEVNYFQGTIALDSSTSKTQIPDKVVVTVRVTSKMPVDGTMTNNSHVTVDPKTSQRAVVCEYHYSFLPSQVAITVTTERGSTLSGTTVNVNMSGTIYTDPATPDSDDISQCRAPAADNFPVSGPMDVTADTLNNFQINDTVLMSLDPGKLLFKNIGTIDLKNNDPNSPLLTKLIIDSLENMTWTTFGTDATTTSGTVTFAPATSATAVP